MLEVQEVISDIVKEVYNTYPGQTVNDRDFLDHLESDLNKMVDNGMIGKFLITNGIDGMKVYYTDVNSDHINLVGTWDNKGNKTGEGN